MPHPLLAGDRLVIAHRGDRAHAPENTFVAFEQALSAGADALEIDVHVTRDGHVVVIHDSRVDRTTDGRGLVTELSMSSLEALDAGARWTPHADPELASGGQRGRARAFGAAAARIPRLESVLEAFPKTPLIIDAKSVRAAHQLVDLIRRHNAVDRVLVGSFIHEALLPLRAAGVRTTASQRELRRLLPAALMARRGFHAPFDAMAIPQRHAGVPVPIGAYARLAGVPVFVWTVNDPDAARRYLQLGATGIITDDPGRMATIRNPD